MSDTRKDHRVRKVWVGVRIEDNGDEAFIAVPDPTNDGNPMAMATSDETTGTDIFPKVAELLYDRTGETIEIREFYDYEVTHRAGVKRQ